MAQRRQQPSKNEIQVSKTAIFNHLKGATNEIQAVAASHIKPEMAIRFFLMAATQNPKLLLCTKESILSSLMQASGLGLDSSGLTGEAFLVPYADVCTFQSGYKGHAKLARNTAQVKDLYAEVVYEKDVFRRTLGLNRDLIHEPPADDDRGEPIGCYGVCKLVNGGVDFQYMTKEQIFDHRDRYSQAWQKAVEYHKEHESTWRTAWAEMWKKTLLNKVLKLAPKSLELVRLEAIESTGGGFDPGATTAALLAALPDVVPEDEPEPSVGGKTIVEVEGRTLKSLEPAKQKGPTSMKVEETGVDLKAARERTAKDAAAARDEGHKETDGDDDAAGAPDKPVDPDAETKKELVGQLGRDLKEHGLWDDRRSILQEVGLKLHFGKGTCEQTVEELDAAIQKVRDTIMEKMKKDDVEAPSDSDWGELGDDTEGTDRSDG